MKKIKCKDHLGNEYNTIKELCSAYSITRHAYHKRIKSGWSLEKTLTTPVKVYEKNTDGLSKYELSKKKFVDDYTSLYAGPNGCCVDHQGNYFREVSEMCDAYGVDYDAFLHRVKNRWSVKDALTKGIDTPGNVVGTAYKIFSEYYASYRDIAEAYGIEGSTIANHKDDIEGYLLSISRIRCNGKLYLSFNQLCSEYNKSEILVSARLRNGWDLKEALITPVKSLGNGHQCKDHKGNVYLSKSLMLAEYGISYSVYSDRIKSGWTQKDALETPVKHKFSGKSKVAKYGVVNR